MPTEIALYGELVVGRHLNNRAKKSRLPPERKERAMSRFQRMRSLQTFTATHASVYNQYNRQRNTALFEWRKRLAA